MSLLVGSFDIGVVNCAFVIIDCQYKVTFSKLSSVENAITYLDSLPLDLCDVILIEKQLPKNRKAFELQTKIQTYIDLIYGPFKNYFLYDSKNKTKLLTKNDVKMSYRERKKFTVDIAEKNCFPFENDCKKKDDLADAFCQALAFFVELGSIYEFYPKLPIIKF
jgi:hypothetical protein